MPSIEPKKVVPLIAFATLFCSLIHRFTCTAENPFPPLVTHSLGGCFDDQDFRVLTSEVQEKESIVIVYGDDDHRKKTMILPISRNIEAKKITIVDDGGVGNVINLYVPGRDWETLVGYLETMDFWSTPVHQLHLFDGVSYVVGAHIGNRSRIICSDNADQFSDLAKEVSNLAAKIDGRLPGGLTSCFYEPCALTWSDAENPASWCDGKRRAFRTNGWCHSNVGTPRRLVDVEFSGGSVGHHLYDGEGHLIRVSFGDSKIHSQPAECKLEGWVEHVCPIGFEDAGK